MKKVYIITIPFEEGRILCVHDKPDSICPICEKHMDHQYELLQQGVIRFVDCLDEEEFEIQKIK